LEARGFFEASNKIFSIRNTGDVCKQLKQLSLRTKNLLTRFAQALIFQSACVTKPEVNDLPFAGSTEIEKVWPFFL
jgi:hypothetical protein